MKLRFGVVADYATVGANGKATIVGIFDSFLRIPGREGAPLPDFYLVASLEGSIVEGGEHALEIRIIDADGSDVTSRIKPSPIKLVPQGPGMPLRASLSIKVQGLKLPAFGSYEIDLVIDGTSVGAIPVHVQQAPVVPGK